MGKIKYGAYGATLVKSNNIMGTVVIRGGQFDNKQGEIINNRTGTLPYITVQVPSEFKNRVYILNLMRSQYTDIKWR